MNNVEDLPPMQQADWDLADAVALELLNKDTDPKELQQLATYARVQAGRDPARVGENLFTLLGRMVRDGHLVRSKQTPRYYRNLSDVCGSRLHDFRSTTRESAWKLVGILGWAARLMRYYRSPEGQPELDSKRRSVGRVEFPQDAEATQARPQSEHEPPQGEVRPKRPAPPPPPPRPKPRPREETARETVTLVSAVKAGKALVRTKKDEEVTCTGMPSYPRASPGEVCRADVTREDGRALRAMFKGWIS
ncbi:MAG: hypothetical protein M3348_07505 [Acidobacteriota bacterium]|nr:hypothetical protein [Acidobacteriota bacterium]